MCQRAVRKASYSGRRPRVRKTKNLAAVKELLGHANVAATGVYLGVTSDDARALAKQFPI